MVRAGIPRTQGFFTGFGHVGKGLQANPAENERQRTKAIRCRLVNIGFNGWAAMMPPHAPKLSDACRLVLEENETNAPYAGKALSIRFRMAASFNGCSSFM